LGYGFFYLSSRKLWARIVRKSPFISTKNLLIDFVILLLANTFVLADTPLAAPPNQISNSGFTGTGKAQFTGWSQIDPTNPATGGVDGADNYVSAAVTDNTKSAGIEQTIPIRPEWARVILRGNIRVVFQNSGAGSTSPVTADSPFVGVMVSWVDKTGHRTSVPNAQTWAYTTPGWVIVNQMLDVPPGTTAMVLAPEVSKSSATASFKDLTLSAWVSTFQDGFSGSNLDPTRWSISLGKHNVRADEQQWFTADSLTVTNNMLRIRATHQAEGGLPFQSGQVSSIYKFQQLFGIFEFQVKIPLVSGAWPAAYLLGWNDDWPPEVDVQEQSGRDTTDIRETNHYSDQYGRHRGSQGNFSMSGLDMTQFHTYTIAWEAGHMDWYFDGIYRSTTGLPYDDVSDVPMYMTMNLACGSYGGDTSQTPWPQDFFIKQVGVYQRSDLPLPVYPGDDQEITLPQNTAKLSAITCNPLDSALVNWTLIEGPATVKIKDPHSVTTTATFSKPGMYRFEVKVTKGASTNNGQYLVYVNTAIAKS